MSDVFKLPVFPAADVFPMMADDELAELAADIKEHGLREPLVVATVEGKTVLVDGRNRRAACKIAGVPPETQALNGEDPTAYVLSANIHRRHMTKGQRAMAVAMIYPEPLNKGGRGKTSAKVAEVSDRYIGYARTALRFAPDLSPQVLSGDLALDKAYETARDRIIAAENQEARMVELRNAAPDLADLVTEERMGFGEAIAAWRERQRVTAQRIEAGQNAARTALLAFSANIQIIQEAIALGAKIELDTEQVHLCLAAARQLSNLITKEK